MCGPGASFMCGKNHMKNHRSPSTQLYLYAAEWNTLKTAKADPFKKFIEENKDLLFW